MNTALITIHAKRPQYSDQVLESASKQAKGLHHIAVLEDRLPEKEAVYSVLEKHAHKFDSQEIHFHSGIPHINNNILHALRVFLNHPKKFGNFIYLEDDNLPTRQAFKYLQWEYRQRYRDPKLSNIALCPSDDSIERNCQNFDMSIKNYSWCALWGFMAPRRMAQNIIKTTRPILTDEEYKDIRANHSTVWDMTYGDFMRQNKMYCVTPIIGRMQNIGWENGLHRDGCTWRNAEEV